MTPRRSTQNPRNAQSQTDRRFLRVLRCTSFFVVVAVASAQQIAPSITIVLTDHHFRLSAPVESGRLLWHVKNEGSEPHQAIVVRLPEGMSEYSERAWFEHGSQGPEPGESMGGVKTLAAGAETTFETNLKPGKYLLLCAMKEDDGPHYELGMIYRFEIE